MDHNDLIKKLDTLSDLLRDEKATANYIMLVDNPDDQSGMEFSNIQEDASVNLMLVRQFMLLLAEQDKEGMKAFLETTIDFLSDSMPDIVGLH